jgi:ammonium transporter, Amt family
MSDPVDLTKQVADLTKQYGDLQTAINIGWTLLTGFLVMFMQLGFALLETGLTRGKNVAHTMGMNIFVYAIGILCFRAVGFGLQMGGVGALGTFGNDPSLASEFSIQIAGKDFGLFGQTGGERSGCALMGRRQRRSEQGHCTASLSVPKSNL